MKGAHLNMAFKKIAANNILPLILMLSLVFLLSGCKGPTASGGDASSAVATPQANSSGLEKAVAVTFTDALSREVTIGNPQKVAVANGSYAEIWLLAGGELAAVTEDAWYERNLNLPDKVVSLGDMKSPSAEAIIACEPDFLVLSSKVAGHLELRETLEAAGINCAYFEVETFEDYLSMLKICTDITSRADLYQENGEAVKAQIDAAIARVPSFTEQSPPPDILLLRAYSTGVKAKGSDNMAGIMLSELGCLNIADSESALLEDVGMERIIAADPDYIFVTTMGESTQKALAVLEDSLLSNPAWQGLSAVKNDRYILLPKELFHYKPNARWGESYEMLADILYGK